MKAQRTVLVIVGALATAVAIGFVFGGAGLLWAGAGGEADGYVTVDGLELETDTYALTGMELELDIGPGDWIPPGRVASVKIDVEPVNGRPLFVGVGAHDEVTDYLAGVAQSEVDTFGRAVTYNHTPGSAPATRPGAQSFWVSSSEGYQSQAVTWDLEPGKWTVVIMNADASPGVAVEATPGVKVDWLGALAGGMLAIGIALGVIGVVLLAAGSSVASHHGESPASQEYPVTVQGRLDDDLSRWQWLLKWLLVLPHIVVLTLLWFVFGVLTIVAGFAILFTGRYPQAIFEFNVGVMRWTWRVAYYSYGALATDEYPPFTLGEADYPATLDVAYPPRLSRGLVLVKWWLLALPHYLIIGLLTSGMVWWAVDLGAPGGASLRIGGGLIGLLVLFAGITIAVADKYPRSLFDLIMGLNRWVYRVIAYAALMTDEYPPFRLDMGDSEGTSPNRPADGADDGAVGALAELPT